ncbi:MAG: hypothetical protein ACAI25_12230 [Planctomycetota bacterium]
MLRKRALRAFVPALLVALVLNVLGAAPAHADWSESLARMREFMATGTPTPRLLNDFAKLPSFEMDVNATQAALDAFGIRSEAGKALLKIKKISKQGDRITIRTKGEVVMPIVMNGEVKGWAKLEDPVSFRLKVKGNGVVVEDFKGISVGPWKSFTVDMNHVKKADWQPGAKNSSLAVTAGWWIFSATFTLALPNPTPPSKTPGISGRLTGG